MQKFPVIADTGEIRFIKLDSIYYIEADGTGDIRIRTRGKKLRRSVERIDEADRRLEKQSNFFRCHRSFIVNLDRVTAIRQRGSAHEIRLDPPVNVWVPVARERYGALKEALGL